jgi:serine/threonine protein kinase
MNILLDWDMTPRIGDFGMSVVLSSDEDEQQTRLTGT